MVSLSILSNGGDTVIFLPCTETKKGRRAPAIEQYFPTGAIAAVKGALNDNMYDENVDTYFLSAEYGVVAGDKELDSYEKEMTQDDVAWMSEEICFFLDTHDYLVSVSFVDGYYKRAMDEAGYMSRAGAWSIETMMLQPCARTNRFDGAKMASQIVRKDVSIDMASDVSW